MMQGISKSKSNNGSIISIWIHPNLMTGYTDWSVSMYTRDEEFRLIQGLDELYSKGFTLMRAMSLWRCVSLEWYSGCGVKPITSGYSTLFSVCSMLCCPTLTLKSPISRNSPLLSSKQWAADTTQLEAIIEPPQYFLTTSGHPPSPTILSFLSI